MATSKFEQKRIKELQDEREAIQKKTFTKWMNSFLDKAGLHVNDLFDDLSDGRLLIRLLEILSGEKIASVGRGKLRINKIENVGKALAFLQQKKVNLQNIGAEDIVDGNPRLILGLVWTMILRFEIEDIELEDESSETKSAKEALLLWCQRKTAGYEGVSVTNFSSSWRNGLAFNAIIHKHRPDLIDYDGLRPNNAISNLNNAFDTAQKQLGIASLLDAEDVDTIRPDDKSIMTYLVAYYHYFSKMKAEETGGRRLNKMIGIMVDIETQKEEYDRMASDLLQWIEKTVIKLSDRGFPNSLPGVQALMVEFKKFRTEQKPAKYAERTNIEIQLFNIQTKLRAAKQKNWYPPEGKLVSDINKAWVRLEAAEHEREVALRRELMRQQKLEQLAEKFNRKAALRESWLGDMNQVLDELNKGQDVHAVDAALKRHEAIGADINAGETRIQVVRDLIRELSHEKFHGVDTLSARGKVIETKWEGLLSKLESCRSVLSHYHDLMSVFAEMNDCLADMTQIETALKSEDHGKHLLGVQDLVQKHTMMEADITTQTERAQALKKQAQQFLEEKHPDIEKIVAKISDLDSACQRMDKLSRERLARLKESLRVQEFYLQVEEEEAWIREKEPFVSSADYGKDINSVMKLQLKHQTLESEIKGRQPHYEAICTSGEKLRSQGQFANKSISHRLNQLQDKWKKLKNMANSRKARLEEAAQYQQYYSDANEAEFWMKEKEPLIRSTDYGHDEASAKSLLVNHERVEEEVKAYSTEMERLKKFSRKIMEGASSSGFDRHSAATLTSSMEEEMEDEEYEVEYEEEEMEVKEVEKEITTEVNVAQVRTLFKYKGQGMGFDKGEVLVLVSKANEEWWAVKRINGQEGFVPASYVKEIEPTKVKKIIKKKETVTVPIKVTKKRIEKRRVPKRGAGRLSSRGAIGRNRTAFGNVKSDGHNIAIRQQGITSTYEKLLTAAELRRAQLMDSIQQFSLFRECDEVESWIRERIPRGFLESDEEDEYQGQHSHNYDAIMKTEEKGSKKEKVDSMQKKLDNFLTDLATMCVRVNEVNSEAEKMIRSGHPQSQLIKARQQHLNERWQGMQRLKSTKDKALDQAKDVLGFQDLCDETHSWINEKDQALSTEDCGRDLSSVQALQRRHQALERELAPVEERLIRLEQMARKVVKENSSQGREVNERKADINTLWDKLKVKAVNRKSQLDNAYLYQMFLGESRDLLKWSNETCSLLSSDELARDVKGAEEMMNRHAELKVEIDTKDDKFDQLQSLGKTVISSASSKSSEDSISSRMRQLTTDRASLKESWEKRNKQLKQCSELQLFLRDAEQVDSATSAQEVFLSNDDLGTSADSVDNLLKKHEEFENTTIAHDDKIRALCEQANRLIQAGHYDALGIDNRREAVVLKRQRVKTLSSERAKKLQASLAWQQFSRDSDEVSAWINEKLNVAQDESYRDPTNLQNKLQKHSTFEAELSSNKGRLDTVFKTGSELVSADNFHSDEIRDVMQDLTQKWKQLTAASALKGNRMKEAWDLHQFLRAAEDESVWVKEAETLLSNEDIGKDLQGVRFLLKNHQQLEADLAIHTEKVKSLSAQAKQLVQDGHFDSTTINKKIKDLEKEFSKLNEPAADRKQQLEDSLEYQQFCRDVEELTHWIKEHRPLAESTDFGKSLVGVQNLQKKHQLLLNEISSYESNIQSVDQSSKDLISCDHFAADSIESLNSEFQHSWKQLKFLAAGRTQKLADALEAQKFYQDSTEADVWMNDKAGTAANQDYGRDEDAAVKALKKHKTLEDDVDGYVVVVGALGTEAKRLVALDHFDSANINARKAQLDEQLAGLQTLTAARRSKLEESIKLHQYLQDVEEVLSWLSDKEDIASSDDYGKDFEHLLIVQKKFEDFKRDVSASTERYTAANNLARRLVAEGHSDTVLIKEKQDAMRTGWNLLQDLIQSRTKKLTGAYEIHKFNRDAREILAKIKDKETSIPHEELGRNMTSVQVLQRKHETFERELTALGNKVRELSNEALRLSTSYPGANATVITNSMDKVQLVWESLQTAANGRKRKLRAASDFQKFLSSVRELITWMHDMGALISTREPVQSVSGAEALQAKHNEHKAELDAREESMSQITKNGKKLIQQGHYASSEIRERLNDLKQENRNLQDIWQEHKNRLDEVLEFQLFLRDAKNIDAMSSAHEVQLSSDKLGQSVDECDALLKKHEAFERLIASQEEKVVAMKDFSSRLRREGHYESIEIQSREKDVLRRRAKVKQAVAERRSKLEDCRKLTVFLQDCNEAESWIDEKLQVANDKSFQDPTNLENKLQRHQEFVAEVNANEKRIKNIAKTGKALVAKSHYAAGDIKSRVDELFQQWKELGTATDNKGVGLQEALSLVLFNRKVDGVQSLISDRVAVANSQETGRDLEHCKVLMRKFDDFQKELTVDKSRLVEVTKLAKKLIKEKHGGEHIIKEHQSSLDAKWEELISLVDERDQLLKGAEQVHKFVRDASETNDRMNEKAKALLTDDYGKDLASVETLIRRHEELERDLTAIKDKLEKLDKEVTRLVAEQPSSQGLINEKRKEIFENWEELTQRADSRKTNLEQSRELQRFLADLRDLLLWAKDMYDRLVADELAKNVAEADKLLELHQERKGEVDAREDNFDRIRRKGESLISEGHYASTDIESRLRGLEEEHVKLQETWKKRQHLFSQCYDLQVFMRDAEQRDGWIGTQEAFLANDDLGDNLDSVEALIKKHEDFEKSLDAQEEKMNAIDSVSKKLMAADHYASLAIANRRDAVLQRYVHLNQSSSLRAQILEDSKKLQQFLRDAEEAEGWISEKLQTASDENYRDTTNLQPKLQKHQAFEAELLANKGRVDSVTQIGEELIDGNHYAAHEIEARIDTLRAHWQNLCEKSADKGQKLKEAWEHQQFLHNVDDIEMWISDMEGQMASEDLGRDLISVNKLLKKHALLENDIRAHQDRIDDVMSQVRQFRDANHFQIDQIEDRGRALVAKYCELEDPMGQRHQQLEDSLKLHEFNHDIEDEMAWIREREPLANNTSLGQSLTSVQSLLKKHQSLESELKSHEQIIDQVSATGQELYVSGHFASEKIRQLKKNLLTAWTNLQEVTVQRSQILKDSLNAQLYYMKLSEAESWMNDRKPTVAQEEYGKDEDATQALIKKHEAVEQEIESYKEQVNGLVADSQKLLMGEHFDSENIKQRQEAIESQYKQLEKLAKNRHHRLVECKQLHHFNRECEEVEQWINDKEVVAANEDMGKDLEHVEILQKRFTDFVHDILASEDRVLEVNRMADTLIETKHTESKQITETNDSVSQLWADLKNLAEARTQDLAGAKEIHTFDRDAGDAKERVQEKDAALSDDYGKDLASVQALQRKHEGFQRDLAALESMIKLLSRESKRLSSKYAESKVHVKGREDEVLVAWEALLARTQARRYKLVESEQLQRFLNTFRDLSSWVTDTMSVLLADELPQDAAGAELVLGSHVEHKGEIDAREASFLSFKSKGEELIAAGHYAKNEIRDKLSIIESSHKELREVYEKRLEEFEHNLDVQIFHRDAEQAEAWISFREGFLGNEEDDLGDSVDTVDEMLKKQEDFEKMLAAQEERFQLLNRETKVEEVERKKSEEEERLRKEEERKKRELEEKRRHAEEVRRRREEEQRVLEEERRRAEEERQRQEEKERREKDLLEAEIQAKKLGEERKQRLLEEEEKKQKEREAQLLASLGSQGVPAYKVQEKDIVKEGMLQRKNELDEGGRKAAARSWRTYHTVLIGPLLNFYKDKKDFQQYLSACPPINVTQGMCEAASDYQKKKNALRLKLANGAEYLFIARDEPEVYSWVEAINSTINGGTKPSATGGSTTTGVGSLSTTGAGVFTATETGPSTTTRAGGSTTTTGSVSSIPTETVGPAITEAKDSTTSETEASTSIGTEGSEVTKSNGSAATKTKGSTYAGAKYSANTTTGGAKGPTTGVSSLVAKGSPLIHKDVKPEELSPKLADPPYSTSGSTKPKLTPERKAPPPPLPSVPLPQDDSPPSLSPASTASELGDVQKTIPEGNVLPVPTPTADKPHPPSPAPPTAPPPQDDPKGLDKDKGKKKSRFRMFGASRK